MCFLLMGACYRHQLIYIYPTVPDSGGRLWVKFISLLPMMMIVSEVTLMGLMSLKKAIAASTWMIPLICITVLFNLYIQQQHFRMTESLPTRIAVRKDKQLEYEEYDFSFLDSLYVQPELRDKEVMPENSTIDREIAQGGGEYGTPQNSIKSDDDDDNEAMDMDVGSGSKAADDFVTGFADVKFDDAAMKMEDVEQVEVSEDSEDLPSDNDVKYDYVKK
uniref:CSC1/OSCA1-like 7TM region domain-containing protein n=2 Tax=Craspedostauros australis TaxID=1486917 RepID=A0A7R9ZMR9_9STRA|mmetsp:Transcript_23856/g.66653  ORF Transcript_23856/g.66653 Transcript_23856/m.66653 type:complete len:219 (+) Transcript_23856:3-659(+)